MFAVETIIIGVVTAVTCAALSLVNVAASLVLVEIFLALHLLVFGQLNLTSAQNLFLPYFSTIGVVVGCTIRSMMHLKDPFKYWGVGGLLLIFWVIFVIARLIVSDDVRASVYSDLFLLVVLPTIAIISSTFLDRKALVNVGLVLIVIGVLEGILVVLGVSGYYVGEDLLISRFHSESLTTIKGYTTLGLQGALAMMMLIIYWHFLSEYIPNILLGVCFILASIALIGGASRAVWFSAVIGCLVVFYKAHKRCCLRLKPFIKLTFYTCLVFVLLGWIVSTRSNSFVVMQYELLRAGLIIASGQLDTFGGRLTAWDYWYGEILERAPFYGYGLGVFPSASEDRIEGETKGMPAADSSLLYVYVLLGWPGIFLFLGMIVAVFMFLLMRHRFISVDVLSALIGIGLLFIIQIPINGVIRSPVVAFALYIVLAIAIKESWARRASEKFEIIK